MGLMNYGLLEIKPRKSRSGGWRVDIDLRLMACVYTIDCRSETMVEYIIIGWLYRGHTHRKWTQNDSMWHLHTSNGSRLCDAIRRVAPTAVAATPTHRAARGSHHGLFRWSLGTLSVSEEKCDPPDFLKIC